MRQGNVFNKIMLLNKLFHRDRKNKTVAPKYPFEAYMNEIRSQMPYVLSMLKMKSINVAQAIKKQMTFKDWMANSYEEGILVGCTLTLLFLCCARVFYLLHKMETAELEP